MHACEIHAYEVHAMKYTPEVYAHEVCAREVIHPPIRCTLVGYMPVRYVSIFANGLVVLDAEPGLVLMSVLAAAYRVSTLTKTPTVVVQKVSCPNSSTDSL